jgi:dihydrolipoamide dehydrogenase
VADQTLTPDLVVIGGGPGGYVASIRAAQLGLSVVCVEYDKTLGGTCVNVGCIPSKALLSSSEHFEFALKHAKDHGIELAGVQLNLQQMLKRKDDVVAQNTKGVEFLFKKNKVTWAKGVGTLKAGNVVEVKALDGALTTYRPKHVILATGSVPMQLPFLPFDEERVLSNVGALRIPEVPKHLIVIGGGVIGLELGSVWRRLGAKVTVIEYAPTVLPGNDDDITKEAHKIFTKQGLEIHTATKVTGGGRNGSMVTIEAEKDGQAMRFEADYALVSIGRKPSLTGVDAESLGLALGKRGEIVVDAQMRTNLANVFAIGDAVGGKLLAHKAEEEGVIAAEVIAGHHAKMHYHNMPGVVYTWPEIATAGLTEAEARATGKAIKVGKFPFSANGRARSMASTEGFVKFVTDASTDEILGCHMIGPNVSDLLSEIVLAMEYRGTADDVGETVHSHPTLSEVVKEAALAALGRAIHI